MTSGRLWRMTSIGRPLRLSSIPARPPTLAAAGATNSRCPNPPGTSTPRLSPVRLWLAANLRAVHMLLVAAMPAMNLTDLTNPKTQFGVTGEGRLGAGARRQLNAGRLSSTERKGRVTHNGVTKQSPSLPVGLCKDWGEHGERLVWSRRFGLPGARHLCFLTVSVHRGFRKK